MSNLLFFEAGVQGTSLGNLRPNQLVTGGSVQPTSQACITDLTPPMFSGIDLITRGVLGQLKAFWLAATDVSNPIRYEVYVKADTSSGLFNVANIALVTTQLQADIFALAGGSLLQSGVNYFVGVRAIDGVGNRDVNTVSLSQTSSGILGITTAEISGVFAVNTSNQLIASFWVNDLEGVIDNPSRLGLASYVIYNDAGDVVVSMSEAGIPPDVNGSYAITPVTSALDLDNSYYTVKVTINVDGLDITYNLPITYPEAGPVYEVSGVISINASNQLQASFWINKNGESLLSNLGTCSFVIKDKSGVAIGISQSGIIADASGKFHSTPVNAVLIYDLQHYLVEIDLVADGTSRKGTVGLVVGE
jgi:hypothetical protein